MRLGFNFTSSNTYDLTNEFIKENKIQFVELLIDNFLHLRPEVVKKDLNGIPVAFHIMKSEYLEKDLQELKNYGDLIRPFIQELKPIYVSDHLARFNIHGKRLPITAEVNYDESVDETVEKLIRWQEVLKTKIILENFPSRRRASQASQATFMNKVIQESDAGLLFDLSNAIVAEKNGAGDSSEWKGLIKKCKNFHIAGFRQSGLEKKNDWFVDSHDCEIDQLSLKLMEFINKNENETTIVVERDANIDANSISKDIRNVRSAYLGDYNV